MVPTTCGTTVWCVVAVVLMFVYKRFEDVRIVQIFVAIAALLLVAMLVAVAMHVANNYLDYKRGTAIVRDGVLRGKRESGRAPKSFYADFDFGPVIIDGAMHARIAENATYRVTYSPRTKKCWSME